MITPFTTPPLTPKTIAILKQLDIHCVEDLQRRGAITAFLQLKNISTSSTESVLWQFIALVENRAAQSLSAEEKTFWRQQIKQHPPVALFPSAKIMQHWMQQALHAAQQAQLLNEVPVGAVVVYENNLIGYGYNRCITDHNISHHAEIQALTAASKTLSNYRLQDCDVYVTLEPCAMCASALIQARVKRVIYGTAEIKTGAAGSVINLFNNRQLNTHTAVLGGILAAESKELLQQFFRHKRKSNQITNTSASNTEL
ncbi:MAG: tRNA adenosine(34) deaminase TadA [Snodgrassella sp.]|uniref:tRNA adenosine(34) deaminase TadA n=1 Tax=Snodgrassella sp. TaxID=2815304 RepID=UPI0025842864|nr:tRNA adenosine(34) deaminase TadA [Snodgrassella sp.]MCO6513492.1 tRNA adenosine(34) deaminase TadA [Snodgrassella sp.]